MPHDAAKNLESLLEDDGEGQTESQLQEGIDFAFAELDDMYGEARDEPLDSLWCAVLDLQMRVETWALNVLGAIVGKNLAEAIYDAKIRWKNWWNERWGVAPYLRIDEIEALFAEGWSCAEVGMGVRDVVLDYPEQTLPADLLLAHAPFDPTLPVTEAETEGGGAGAIIGAFLASQLIGA